MSAPSLDEKIQPVSEASSSQAAVAHQVQSQDISETGPPPFQISHLWSDAIVNPLNLKAYNLPIFNLRSPYARNFHLAWLGFFVAFLSWFAFPPLFPEAITKDLKLTKAQVANSNIVALSATLIVRLFIGPAVDRFGPRWVMAGILVAGAIPSGLAGTIHNANGLYVIRFFIGVLGGTFVPCVAWTTAFFDKSIVGTANALSAGWGNAGGGATYAIMVSLYARLHKHMSQHKAWRIAFVAVPVPVLIFVAALVLVFGTDSPAGKWSQRHMTPATAAAVMAGHEVVLDKSEQQTVVNKKREQASQTVQEVDIDADEEDAGRRPSAVGDGTVVRSDIDVAVNEPLTLKSAIAVITNPLSWICPLAYMTTFGFELAVDSNLASVILTPHPKLGQLDAGYLASVFGLLNIITRPLGGYFADILFRRYKDARVKKYFTLALGLGQGAVCLGFGILLRNHKSPSLGVMMVLIVIMAFFNEFANGANFSLTPHCNAYNNGFMSGLVGAFGNLGGIFYALMFRFQPKQGHGFIVAGGFALGVNALLFLLPSPRR